MKITRFEDIQSWQMARVLMNQICDVTERDAFSRKPRLRAQLEEASASIMANVAEGFDGGSDAEFRRFLRMAARSATEIQSHLYRCIDRKLIDQRDFGRLYAKAADVRTLIRGFIRYLSNEKRVTSK